MEYVFCCLCCMACFLCGVWAANRRPVRRRERQAPPEETQTNSGMDVLSRDIAAMLAYTVPGKEEPQDEE
ncbi:MAG: hypothetical protein ACI4PM_03705 [Butyricicoccus sp.]